MKRKTFKYNFDDEKNGLNLDLLIEFTFMEQEPPFRHDNGNYYSGHPNTIEIDDVVCISVTDEKETRDTTVDETFLLGQKFMSENMDDEWEKLKDAAMKSMQE